MLTAVDGAVQLVVDRPYKAGDPIVVWCVCDPNCSFFLILYFLLFCVSFFFSRCGPQPNAKLLLNYGFIDEDNPYDRIIVEVFTKF